MLVPKESILRRLPTSLERKDILYLDGIRYSIEIFELAGNRLAQTLHMIGTGSIAGDNTIQIPLAIADAWVLIDAAHRLRELLMQVPKMKKNEPELQLFLRSTSSVEDLRNFVQHFRNEIDSYSKLGSPLWGTISWIMSDPETKDLTNHVIVPGTFFKELIAPGCVFDTHEGRFVQRIVLQAGKYSIDLADLHDALARFVTWYLKWFESIFTGTDRHGADAHFQLTIKPVYETKSPDAT